MWGKVREQMEKIPLYEEHAYKLNDQKQKEVSDKNLICNGFKPHRLPI